VAVGGPGTRRDEEWVVKLVAKDGGVQAVGDVGDVDQLSGNEPVAVVDLKVVAVRPLSASTVAVVSVVLNGQVVLSRPVEVGKSNHVIDARESTSCDAAHDISQAGIRELQERTGSIDALEGQRGHG